MTKKREAERTAESREIVWGFQPRSEAVTGTYPHLSGGRQAAFHDVPDFAHATGISVGHALPVRTPVTVSEEAITRGLEQLLLDGRGRGERAPVLGCHVNVQRRQSAVIAYRFFPAGTCARAVETGPACRRARRSELSGRR